MELIASIAIQILGDGNFLKAARNAIVILLVLKSKRAISKRGNVFARKVILESPAIIVRSDFMVIQIVKNVTVMLEAPEICPATILLIAMITVNAHVKN